MNKKDPVRSMLMMSKSKTLESMTNAIPRLTRYIWRPTDGQYNNRCQLEMHLAHDRTVPK